MNQKEKALNLLGMAMKAGKIVSGESLTLKEIQSQRAKIVILATDASENTKKKFLDKCKYYDIPIVSNFTKDQISRSIGKNRAVCAVSDKGFSAKLQEYLIK